MSALGRFLTIGLLMVACGCLEERTERPEYDVASTLRIISSAQNRIVLAQSIDVDRDGKGEFGYISELLGISRLRGRETALGAPVLPRLFTDATPDGSPVRVPYIYRMYLPGSGTGASAEVFALRTDDLESPSTAQFSLPADVDGSERVWCCYAWPAWRGKYGRFVLRHTLFICQDGQVLVSEDSEYFGACGPRAGAAFRTGGPDSILGVPAKDCVGQDGSVWKSMASRLPE